MADLDLMAAPRALRLEVSIDPDHDASKDAQNLLRTPLRQRTSAKLTLLRALVIETSNSKQHFQINAS
jgi:hypothetical protein